MRNCTFFSSAFRITLGLFLFASAAQAQNTLTKVASEYAIVGSVPGDQVKSHVDITGNGGWLVWQDNATDPSGAGISARRLGSSLSGEFNHFRVNQIGAGEQENPRVVQLDNGGAAFVWQGGPAGLQEIYLRILGSSGVFTTGDVLVNTYTNQQQSQPVIARLTDGNLVISWSSFGQDGSMQGIYARIFTSSGVPVTGEIQVNQTTALNQRQPSIASLSDGGFIVVFASERQVGDAGAQAGAHAVDVLARRFAASGTPLAGEFGVANSGTIEGHPSVVATDLGYFVAWAHYQPATTNSWDIRAQAFSLNNAPTGNQIAVNSHLYGDQFSPLVSAQGTNVLVVWTSLRQDGSYEGVFARPFTTDGASLGSEICVNTTTQQKQIQPSVAADNAGRFLVVWSSFVGGSTSYDLFAQRFSVSGSDDSLYPPDAPFVSALNSTNLSVTWPQLSGYPVAFYELYVDGSSSPIVVTGIQATVSALAPGSTHTFRLLYELADGRRSPLSSPVQGTTWGEDLNGDGLPDDWQSALWGANPDSWPAVGVDTDGDGASNAAEFLAGTDPTDAGSVLRTRLRPVEQGFRFSWNTQPGSVYQVQGANSFENWQNVGTPRFAYGGMDSITITPGNGSAFYRVIRLR